MNLGMRLFRRAGNGVWYVEFPGGKRRSLGKEVKTEPEAKRVYNQIRREFLAGKLADITGQCSVALEEYVVEYREWAEQVQPPATFRANMLALSKLRQHAGKSVKLDKIGLKHVDMMVAESRKEGLTTASINHYIRHMRTALNKAVEWGYVQRNPVDKAKELPKERKPPAFLTQKEAGKFLTAISDVDLRRLATAYLSTGRRRNELLALEWSDIDFDNDRYYVRKAKNHLSRWYPLPPYFKAVLLAIGPGEGKIFTRWHHPDTISHYIKKALVKSGSPQLHLHSLRHSFASIQVMQGRDLRTVQELLGHTEFKTTEIYAHLDDAHLKNAVEIQFGPLDLGD